MSAPTLNILYGVVGEGMGHATRSSVIITHLLSRGHTVKVMASGRAFHFLKERFGDVETIHGLHIVYADNAVERRRTVWSNLTELPENLLTNVSAYFDLIGSFTPDLVISDFDSFTWLYARNHGLPIVSIDNMQVINRCSHPDLPESLKAEFRLTKALIKGKLPGCSHYFITSFFSPPIRKPRTSLYPPILRQKILDADRREGDHILVYQTSDSFTGLVPALQRMKDVSFRVYGLRRREDLGNVQLFEFSEDGFVDDLASARAVIAGGGYSLMGEALYLKKPMLSVPVNKQFEQVLNGHYLHELGYGEWWEALEEDLLRQFLLNVPRYRENLEAYHQDGNQLLFDALDTHLPAIAAGARPSFEADEDP